MAASSSASAPRAPRELVRHGSKSPSILSEVSTVPSAFRDQVAQEISTALIDDVEPQVSAPIVTPPDGSRPQGHRPVPANRVLLPAAETHRTPTAKDHIDECAAGWAKASRDSPTTYVGSWADGSPCKDPAEAPREVAREMSREETSNIFDANELPIPPRAANKDLDWTSFPKKFSDSAVSTEPGTMNPAYMNTLSNSSSAKTLQSSTEFGTMLPGSVASGVLHGSGVVNPLSNSSSAKTLQTWSEVAPLLTDASEQRPVSEQRPGTVDSHVSSFHLTDSESVAGHLARGLLSGVSHPLEHEQIPSQSYSKALSPESWPSGGPSVGEAIRPSTAEEAAAFHARNVARGSFPARGPDAAPGAKLLFPSDEGARRPSAQSQVSMHSNDAEVVAGHLAQDILGYADSMLKSRDLPADHMQSRSGSAQERPATCEEVAALHAAQLTTFMGEELVQRGFPIFEPETVLSVGGSDASLLARNEASQMVNPASTEPVRVDNAEVLFLHTPESLLRDRTTEQAKVSSPEVMFSGNESVMSLAASTLDELAAVQTAQLLAGAGEGEAPGSSQQQRPSRGNSAQRRLPPELLQEQLAQNAYQQPTAREKRASKSEVGESMSGVSVYSLDEPSEMQSYGNVADDLVREVMLSSGHPSVHATSSSQVQRSAAAARPVQVAPTGAKVDSSAWGNTSVLSVTTTSDAERAFAVAGIVGNIMESSALPVFAESPSDPVLSVPSTAAESAAKEAAASLFSDPGSKQQERRWSGVESRQATTMESAAKDAAAEIVEKSFRGPEEISNPTRSVVGSSLENSIANGVADKVLETCVSEFAEAAGERSFPSKPKKFQSAEDPDVKALKELAKSKLEAALGAGNLADTLKDVSREMQASRKDEASGRDIKPGVRTLLEDAASTGALRQALAEVKASGKDKERTNSSVITRSVEGTSQTQSAADNVTADIVQRCLIGASKEQTDSSVVTRSVEASLQTQSVADNVAADILHQCLGADKEQTDSSVVTRSVDASLQTASVADNVAADIMQRCVGGASKEQTESSVNTRSVDASLATPSLADDVTADIMRTCFTIESAAASAADGEEERPPSAGLAHQDLIDGFLKADVKSRDSDPARSSPSDELVCRSIAGNTSEDMSSRAAEDIVGQTIFGCIFKEGDRCSFSQQEGSAAQLVVRPDVSRRPSEILSEDSGHAHANVVQNFMLDCLDLADDEATGYDISRTTDQSLMPVQPQQRASKSSKSQVARDVFPEDVSAVFTATDSLPSHAERLLGKALMPTDDELLDIHVEKHQEDRTKAEKELLAKSMEVDELRAQLQRESQRAQQAEKELAGLRMKAQQQPLPLAPKNPEADAARKEQKDELQEYLEKLNAQNKVLAQQVSTQSAQAAQFRQLYLDNQKELVAVRENLEKTRSHDAEELRQLRQKLDEVRNRSVQELKSAQSKAQGPDAEAVSARTTANTDENHSEVNELKDILVNAARSGDLTRALKQVTQKDNDVEPLSDKELEENRLQLQETMLTASRSGKLEEILREVTETPQKPSQEYTLDEVEASRVQLQELFVNAAHSGQLQELLRERSSAGTSFEVAEPSPDPEDDLEDIRIRMKSEILEAANSGELDRLLKEAAEKDMSAKALEESRLHLKNCLIQAASTGDLDKTFSDAADAQRNKVRTEETEKLRTGQSTDEMLEESRKQLSACLLAASRTGTLEKVLKGVKPDEDQSREAAPQAQEPVDSQLESLRLRVKSHLTQALASGDLEQRLREIAEKGASTNFDAARLKAKKVLTDACLSGDLERVLQDMKEPSQSTTVERSMDFLDATPEDASSLNNVQEGLKNLLTAACNSGALERALTEQDAVEAEPAPLTTREIVIEQLVSSDAETAPIEEKKPQGLAQAPAKPTSPKSPKAPDQRLMSPAESNRRLRAIFYSSDIEEDKRGVDWAKKRELIRVCRISKDIADFLCVKRGDEEHSLQGLGTRDKFTFAQLKAFYNFRSSTRAENAGSELYNQQPQQQPVELKAEQTDAQSAGFQKRTSTVQCFNREHGEAILQKSLDLDAVCLSYGRSALRLTPHVFVSREPILSGLDSSFGLMQTYGVAPELPAGLELDSASGWLHGVPIENTPLQSYEISAEIVTGEGKSLTLQTTIQLGVGQAAAPAAFQPAGVGSQSPTPGKDKSLYASNDSRGPSSPMVISRPDSRLRTISQHPSTKPSSPASVKEPIVSKPPSRDAQSKPSARDAPALAQEMYDYAIECATSSDVNGLKALIKSGIIHPAHVDSKQVVDDEGHTLLEIARANGDSKILSLFFGALVRDVGKKPQPIVETVPHPREQSRRSLYMATKIEMQGASGSFFYPSVPEILPYDTPCTHSPKISAGLNVKEFSVWPPLPKGLELNTQSGELFGIGEEEMEEELYTVTAVLEGDDEQKVNCTLSFSVEEIQPPFGLSYPSVQRIVDSIRADEMTGVTTGLPELKKPTLQKTKTGKIDAPIPTTPRSAGSPNRRLFRRPPSHIRVLPTLEMGTATRFEVDPQLPLGMTLDEYTGEIRGAPALNERKCCATNHTVLAENSEGMALCGISIEVTTGAWDLTMLNMRTTWTKNQNELEDKMRQTTADKGRRATQMRKQLEPISRPKDVGRVDWKSQLDRSVSIIEQFAHLVPVQQLDGPSKGSTIVKGMDASSLLKCLGIKEDPHTVTALIQAVELTYSDNPGMAILATAEGKKNKEPIIYLRASGECAEWQTSSEKKIDKVNNDKAAQIHEQAYAPLDFKPTHALKRHSMKSLGKDASTWTQENLDREFKMLMPHWKDRMFTGGITDKLTRFKTWRNVCCDVSAPELSSKELE